MLRQVLLSSLHKTAAFASNLSIIFAGAESSTMKTLPDDESGEIVSLQSSATESLPQATEKNVPVEKRLRFQVY